MKLKRGSKRKWVGLLALISASLGYSLPALAQQASGKYDFTIGAMALLNSTQQGGQGPKGSTVLTQTNLVYTWSWYALGAFCDYDLQGSNEKDIAIGPKIELNWSLFYIEAGYAIYMNRGFTDRTIANQSGNGWLYGLGVRVPLGASQSFFLDFSYKIRTQIINKQDSTLLDQPITQTDGYPIFGLGFKF